MKIEINFAKIMFFGMFVYFSAMILTFANVCSEGWIEGTGWYIMAFIVPFFFNFMALGNLAFDPKPNSTVAPWFLGLSVITSTISFMVLNEAFKWFDCLTLLS